MGWEKVGNGHFTVEYLMPKMDKGCGTVRVHLGDCGGCEGGYGTGIEVIAKDLGAVLDEECDDFVGLYDLHWP